MERVQVSGTVPGVERAGWVNQLWNWVMGEGEREERWRGGDVNCAAREGWGVWEGSVVVVGEEEVVGSPGAKMSFSLCWEDMVGW